MGSKQQANREHTRRGQLYFLVTAVSHASSADISSLRAAPILYHWQLIPTPPARIICFQADILNDAEQVRCFSRPVRQEEMRESPDGLVRQAIESYGEIPPEQRDFDGAKAAYQHRDFDEVTSSDQKGGERDG